MHAPAAVCRTRRAAGQGYASRQYAEALAEFGEVRELPASGGALLVRRIPQSDYSDAIGCYPLFSCGDWQGLANDLPSLADALVSVTLVADPFAEAPLSLLRSAFPDLCYAYKEHYVTDLARPLEEIVEGHHRRNVRKALAKMETLVAPASPTLLTAWQSLYANLVTRHSIDGIARFSARSFARQMEVPGFTALVATDGDDVIGMTLWYVRGEVAYYHLGAYSDRGYECGASFALFWQALSHFQASGVRWAALGAGAGTNAAESGLTRFKQGWSTGTRTAYLCGRILQRDAYRRLAGERSGGDGFFPAYRRAAL
jgi:hypothetical protein